MQTETGHPAKAAPSKSAPVLHPLFMAAYPVVFLYAHNRNQVSPDEIWLPLAASIAAAVILTAVFTLLLRSPAKAGCAASTFLMLFFSYGRFYDGWRSIAPKALLPWDHTMLGGFLGLLFLGLAWKLRQARSDFAVMTRILNVGAALLLAFPVSGLVWGAINDPPAETQLKAASAATATGRRPHIFYLVLDSYARADVLRDVYEYDNGDFLKFLESEGFTIASESQANYNQTYLSLASSLNYDYLDATARRLGPNSRDFRPLIGMIKKNRAMRFLKASGYATVAFASGFEGTHLEEADELLSPAPSLTDFQNELLDSTPALALRRWLPKASRFDRHRELISYIFDRLPDIAARTEPTFVFAHIISPHTPFVFGPRGERVPENDRFTFGGTGYTRDEYLKLYPRQLAYINGKIRDAVREIKRRSPTPPVIVLQADHGPGIISKRRRPLWERQSILNAYYLPGNGRPAIAPGATPVNTFRIIFNSYFDSRLPPLADRLYFSLPQSPYRFDKTGDVFPKPTGKAPISGL